MTTAETVDTDTHDDEHDHMSDWDYVKIALLLAVITGVEVFTYFESVVDWGKALIPALLVMMVIKFAVVVAFFMHLKFDSRIFTRVFVTGLCFALFVYMVMILAFTQHPWEIFQG